MFVHPIPQRKKKIKSKTTCASWYVRSCEVSCDKTNLFLVTKNILCWDSSVISAKGLDYCSAIVFRLSFNKCASLACVKSTRHFCQIILFCFVRIKRGPTFCFQALCVCEALNPFHVCTDCALKTHTVIRWWWLMSNYQDKRKPKLIENPWRFLWMVVWFLFTTVLAVESQVDT